MLTVNEASGFGSGGGAGGRADVGDAPQTELIWHFRADVGVTDSSGVTAWLDQVGESVSLTAATTHKPTYNSTATVGTLANAGAIEFDGVAHDLTSGSVTDASTPTHVFLVFQMNDWTSGDEVMTIRNSGESHFQQLGSSPNLKMIGGGTPGGDTSFATGSWALASILWNGSSSSLARNNDSPNAAALGARSMAAGMTLAASGSPGNWAWGDIDVAELLIYSAEQTGAALTSIKSYINDQYGLW